MNETLINTLLGWLNPDIDSNDGVRWSRPGGLITDPELYDEVQLDATRKMARYLASYNEYAIAAHRTRKNYIIGQGLVYEPVPARDGLGISDLETQACKQWLDAFAEVNDLPTIEEEMLYRRDRDGEAFLRLFFDPGVKIPELRWVEPEYITSKGATVDPATKLINGVIVDRQDSMNVLGYRHETEAGEYEILEPDEIVHFVGNVTSRAVRGIPIFFAVFEGLIECKELLRGLTKIAKARAKIAMLIKVAGLNKGLGDEIIKRLTARSGETEPGQQTSVPIEKMPFGSVLRISDKDQIDLPMAQLGAADYVEALQARLRAVGVAVNMSEWMFTGLADQKYSNSFVVEAPTLKSFLDDQGYATQRMGSGRYGRQESVVRKAMRIAAQQGTIPEDWLRIFRIKCTGPSLEARDPGSEAATARTLIETSVVSRQTIRERQGLNNATEEQRIEREKSMYPAVPQAQQPAPTPAMGA